MVAGHKQAGSFGGACPADSLCNSVMLYACLYVFRFSRLAEA